MITFNNRVPGTKTSVEILAESITQVNNELIIIGHALAGITEGLNTPYQVLAFGDEVAAKTEIDALYGVDSEVSKMVVAAIDGVKYSDLPSISFPKIKVIAMASTDDDLEALLTSLPTLPMPHVAVWFDITDATLLSALKLHLEAISGSNKGRNGQFGSFGYPSTLGEFATVSPIAEAGSIVLAMPWLRDGDVSPSQTVAEVSARAAALAAANPRPYNPTNGVRIGKMLPPVSTSDYHTDGDTGTVALGLDSGLIPLTVNAAGEVEISRLITSVRTDGASPDSVFYDVQDWQVLYDFRAQSYLLTKRPQFRNKKNSIETRKALLSATIKLAKDFEALGMFQNVDAYVDKFKVETVIGNPGAVRITVPVNVIPGLHQIGIEIKGVNQIDVEL